MKDLLKKSVHGETIVMDYEEGRDDLFIEIGKRTVEFAKLFLKPIEGIVKSIVKTAMSPFTRGKEKKRFQNKNEIFFESSGATGYVYFNYKKEHINLSEINKKYPKLVRNLINHPGIGLIVGKDNDTVHAIGKGGRVVIDKTGKYKTIDSNVLARFGNTKTLVGQINNLMRKRCIGDLVVFGNVIKDRLVDFENRLAAHAGLGGEQNTPFFISKKPHPELKNSKDSRAIYDIFMKYAD
jgi:hypothetical protein